MKSPLLALLLLTLPSIQAGDSIWSALVLATNERPARDVPRKLETFGPAVEQVFGYNSLYLLGDKKQEIDDRGEMWLVPSRDFFFQARVVETGATFYQVQLELFRNKESLLRTTVRLARNAPLYIRGPQWGNGQLLLLLEVR